MSQYFVQDISYTKAPTWIKIIPRYEHDQHSSFSSLATLAFPELRAENAVEPRESPQNHVKLPPDEQLLCYDYLYYVCSHQASYSSYFLQILKAENVAAI